MDIFVSTLHNYILLAHTFMWVSFLFFVCFRLSRRRLIAPVRSVSLHPIGKPAPNYHILYLWGGRRFDQILGGIRQIFPIPPGL